MVPSSPRSRASVLLTTLLAVVLSIALVNDGGTAARALDLPAQGTGSGPVGATGDGSEVPVDTEIPEVADDPEDSDESDLSPSVVITPGVPALSGTARVGQRLTVSPGSWEPQEVTLAIQWRRGDVDIADATAFEYTLGAADVGHRIRATVTGSLAESEPVTVTSGPSAVVAAAVLATRVPTVTGTARVGATLRARAGTWTSGTAFTYQWLRAGKPISGARAVTYTPVAADRGKRVSVTVTGARPGYATASRTSDRTAAIAYGVLSSSRPTISGTVRVGSTLTARPGTWTAGTSFTYQWRVNGKPISGATRASYTPKPADHGKKITVVVTGNRSGYNAKRVTSAATRAVTLGVFSAAPTPAISGTVRVGQTLRVNAGRWAPNATLRYQWYAGGRAVSGATGATYRLSAANHNKAITVTVRATRTGYNTKTVTSRPTLRVARPFTRVATPTTAGNPRVGSTLTARPGSWSPNPTFSYQWYAGGRAIAGATGRTYRVTAADHSKRITVKVTARRTAYVTASRTSARTSAVVRGFATAPSPPSPDVPGTGSGCGPTPVRGHRTRA